MIRPYVLAETNWKHLREENIELAILPWGATEAHNYHLPYGTDNYQVEAMVLKAAGEVWELGQKVMVLPTIPFGVNTGQPDIYLDINLNPSTQLAMLRDIVTVLDRQGIHKLLVVNGHGGNDFKPILRELGLQFPKMFLSYCFFPKMVDTTKYFELPGDHADEMETSLMLYLHQNLVLPRTDWGSGATKKFKMKSFTSNGVWAERRWSQITEDTGSGNPNLATAEKGKQFFNTVCTGLSKVFQEICEVDIDQLYE